MKTYVLINPVDKKVLTVSYADAMYFNLASADDVDIIHAMIFSDNDNHTKVEEHYHAIFIKDVEFQLGIDFNILEKKYINLKF